MVSPQPKLRPDLIVSRQQTPEGAVFVVKDPAGARFFRLREAEFCLARELDGATPPEVARRRIEERFEATIPPDALERFVAKLARLGLLETQGADTCPRPSGRVRGSLLYLRLRTFDPDRVLSAVVDKLGWLFTPGFVILSGGLMLLALGITVANGREIAQALRHFASVQALLLAWVTILLVAAAHELAHGLTCKRFGGAVHELGILLLYFQPALYCNVSDAWLFPQRSRRLWVTAAGAYCDLVLWAVAVVTWRVTEPVTAVNGAALVVMATSAIKTAFNLNPLIKLDGYYLLSDWLDVPNLRPRAFAYLGARVRRILGTAAPEDFAPATPRQRWIYLLYGVSAGAFSMWLLSVVALHVGGALVARYQGLGFIVFASSVLAFVRKPLGRAAAAMSSAVAPAPAPGGPPPGRPGGRGLPTTRGRLPAPWRRAGLAAAVAAGLAVLFLARMELSISGDFRILPAERADVRAEVEGIIDEIAVDEGAHVARGDLIARLSEREYRAELRRVLAELEEKQARRRLLEAGPRSEEIELGRTAVRKAEERLVWGRARLRMFKADENLVSRKEIEEVEEEVAVRTKELEEASGRLKILLAGSRREEIEAIAAEIARADAQRAYLEEQVALGKVVSPIAGVVTTPKLRDKVGRHVNKGDLIAEVHALETVTAEIAVSEKDISAVRPGQTVTLKARAYPGTSFSGRVVAIAPVVTKQDAPLPERAVLVQTRLENPSLLLKPGMTGNAKIRAGRRRFANLLTRRAARFVRVEFWSWW